MNAIERKYKNLYEFYRNELSSCLKEASGSGKGLLRYLQTYLRYLRDCRILLVPTATDLSKDMDFAALCLAVSECDVCLGSICGRSISTEEQKPGDVDHSQLFYELVRQYLDKWEAFDDLAV